MSSQAGDGRGVYGGVSSTQCDPEVDINTHCQKETATAVSIAVGVLALTPWSI